MCILLDEELAKTEITSLYKKILGRIPDNDGLESYTKQLRSGKMTLDGVEKHFMNLMNILIYNQHHNSQVNILMKKLIK